MRISIQSSIVMTTLTLKSYQQSALDALATYARAARIQGPAAAFAQQRSDRPI